MILSIDYLYISYRRQKIAVQILFKSDKIYISVIDVSFVQHLYIFTSKNLIKLIINTENFYCAVPIEMNYLKE